MASSPDDNVLTDAEITQIQDDIDRSERSIVYSRSHTPHPFHQPDSPQQLAWLNDTTHQWQTSESTQTDPRLIRTQWVRLPLAAMQVNLPRYYLYYSKTGPHINPESNQPDLPVLESDNVH